MARTGRASILTLAAVMLVASALALGLYSVVGDGGSSGPALAPEDVIAQAAEATLAETTTAMTIASEGGDGQSYSFEGLADLAGGEFDLRLAAEGPSIPRFPKRLVGARGEEAVYDVLRGEFPSPRSKAAKKLRGCWFSNPSPTAVPGGISIEEGAVLAIAVVDSLRRKIADAEALGSGTYAVELKPSASRAKSPRSSAWAGRSLLDQLQGPITVALADGRVGSIGLALENYKPAYSPGLYRIAKKDRINRDGVPMLATFATTGRVLKLTRPSCAIVT